MKLKFFIVLVIISATANAQHKRDTLFINKEADQVVFMDSPYSTFHDQVFKNLLADTLFNERYTKQYSTFGGQWITVKKYKQRFVAYHPSEPFYNTFLRLTDSTVLFNDFNDGFVSYKISRRKETQSQAKFELVGDEGASHSLCIKQEKNTIFSVKSSLFGKGKLYFVKRKDFYDFPVIVNYCPANRCPEFGFK